MQNTYTQFAVAVSPENPAQTAMAHPGTLYIAALTMAVLRPSK